jgi:hypothetical protein
MRIQEYNLFPTAVTVVKNFFTEQQCNQIFNFILKSNICTSTTHNALRGNINTTYNTNIINIFPNIKNSVPGCEDIVEKLNSQFKHYCERTGYVYHEPVVQSWYTIQQKYSALSRHPHPNSCFSGVIFINVDINSSPLVFDTPNPYTIHEKYDKLTEFVFDNFTVIPEIGDLIIFPSWLYHGSGNNLNMTENRTIISFNVTG